MTTVSPPRTEINSVLALYSTGQTQEALGAVEALIKSYPNDPFLYSISGACFAGLGQLDKALKSYEKALAIKPDYAEVHYNLGVTLQALGQLDAAVKSYEKAIAIKSGYADAYINLGITLKNLGQLDAAVKSYEQALAINPNYAKAHNNLGNALDDLGQLDAAVKSYEQALAINPNFAEAHNNLGNALKNLGQLDASIKSFKQALAIKPDYAEAHNNLGNALTNTRQLNAALKSYEKALAIKPDYAEAYINLGITLNNLGQLDAAVKSYEKAIAIEPDYAEAYRNLGSVLLDLRRMDEALVSFERALAINPDLDFTLGKLLHTKMHLCLWDDLSSMLDELQDKINNNEKVIDPFPMLGLIDDPELQRIVTEIFVNKNFPKSHDLPRIALYPKHKKIRIGYFSCDFREHPVSALTAELYEIHDRSRFEIHAFSYGPDTEDKMNLRIKAGVDHFHDVRTMPHKDVAMLARSLEIDIAVDLGGYTKCQNGNICHVSSTYSGQLHWLYWNLGRKLLRLFGGRSNNDS